METQRPGEDLEKIKELEIKRHSASHLMAAAVLELWPEARFGVGPVVKNGFYYDFDLPVALSIDDLPRIEAKMQEIQARSLCFERSELEIPAAIKTMTDLGQNYKVELLELLRDKGSTAATGVEDQNLISASQVNTVSFYRLGDFLDLCRGPHVASTKEIPCFKLMSVSGAYWRGSEKNKQLQRVYGLAFDTQEELNDCVHKMEEAKKRDHRRLGEELEIFFFSEDVGQGLPLWLPNGTVLRDELEKVAKEEERRDGYQRVVSPHITKDALYYRSGHLPYYRDDMYSPINIEGQDFFLRPMNCPHHHQMFAHRPHSYRELPIRLAEYGQVYRFEQSGTLSGLMRVRGFCQNDAHIYCRHDQAEEEFLAVMRLHARLYELLGIKNYYMRLSLPGESNLAKYVDDPGEWLKASEIIRAAMVKSGLPFVEAKGEAAFYGPKIDFMIESVVGVEYALSTNQLDFLASKRFNLNYVGEDSKEYPVYVIHRAPLGAHERVVAFLIEQYAGNFPVWLAPVQAAVIPIAERHTEYARKVYDVLFNADVKTAIGGVRVELDDSRLSMQKRIRNATVRKIPYMLVVGDREAQEGTVSVRLRNGVDLKAMPLEKFLERIGEEIKTRQDLSN